MFNYKEVNNLKVKVVVLIFSTTHTCPDEFLFTIYSCGTLFTKSSCTAARTAICTTVKYI